MLLDMKFTLHAVLQSDYLQPDVKFTLQDFLKHDYLQTEV